MLVELPEICLNAYNSQILLTYHINYKTHATNEFEYNAII